MAEVIDCKEAYNYGNVRGVSDWESQSRDSINVRRIYIDLAGNLAAGVLLSQIVYWWLPNKRTGKIKLRIEREGGYWLAKSRHDWWDECRLTPRQVDRALKILCDKELIATKIFKFNGAPTTHVRLTQKFIAILNAKLEEQASSCVDRNYETTNSPIGEMELPDSGRTMDFPKNDKSITENTEHEIKKQRGGSQSPDGDGPLFDFIERQAREEKDQTMAAEEEAAVEGSVNPTAGTLSLNEFRTRLIQYQKDKLGSITDGKYCGQAINGIRGLYRGYKEGAFTLQDCFDCFDWRHEEWLDDGEVGDKANWLYVYQDMEVWLEKPWLKTYTDQPIYSG